MPLWRGRVPPLPLIPPCPKPQLEYGTAAVFATILSSPFATALQFLLAFLLLTVCPDSAMNSLSCHAVKHTEQGALLCGMR